MAKTITAFVWGALEASLIFLVCVFPPDIKTWTSILLVPLFLSSAGLLLFLVSWIVYNWDRE